MFLARETRGGLGDVRDLYEDEFWEHFKAALEFYTEEAKRPIRVVLSGIEKK